MTRRSWIADEVSGDRAALLGSHADHLIRVLRARVGQAFDVSTGDKVRRGRITRISDGRVEFELGDVVPAHSLPKLTIVLSIFKFDRMEWAIEKCTELGAAQMIPLIARRTEKHLAAAAPKRVERWRRIGHAASEQSRRLASPQICEPIEIGEVIARLAGMRIVLSESEHVITLKEALRSQCSDARRAGTPALDRPGLGIALAFGPEGGWDESEIAQFRSAGWISASLGSSILRAETAAIAAVAITIAELQ
jgi:16S rRNA (uracil1498-N3)-methyltransferase